jgi:hypothetical protein
MSIVQSHGTQCFPETLEFVVAIGNRAPGCCIRMASTGQGVWIRGLRHGDPTFWYLQLTGQAASMFKAKQPIPSTIPIAPLPDIDVAP